jgi:hypothetical protein
MWICYTSTDAMILYLSKIVYRYFKVKNLFTHNMTQSDPMTTTQNTDNIFSFNRSRQRLHIHSTVSRGTAFIGNQKCHRFKSHFDPNSVKTWKWGILHHKSFKKQIHSLSLYIPWTEHSIFCILNHWINDNESYLVLSAMDTEWRCEYR